MPSVYRVFAWIVEGFSGLSLCVGLAFADQETTGQSGARAKARGEFEAITGQSPDDEQRPLSASRKVREDAKTSPRLVTALKLIERVPKGSAIGLVGNLRQSVVRTIESKGYGVHRLDASVTNNDATRTNASPNQAGTYPGILILEGVKPEVLSVMVRQIQSGTVVGIHGRSGFVKRVRSLLRGASVIHQETFRSESGERVRMLVNVLGKPLDATGGSR